MVSWIARGFAAASVIFAAGATLAQETSTNKVAVKTDWVVFEEQNPRECWAFSLPTAEVFTRDGRRLDPGEVRRGEIQLMTFYKPGSGIAGQVTFTGGYPFAKGSTVNLKIDDQEFELLTQGEWAWPATTADDAKIIAAMKRGTDAVLTARSSRGTTTKDTFSLMGYTAAVEEAEKRCQ